MGCKGKYLEPVEYQLPMGSRCQLSDKAPTVTAPLYAPVGRLPCLFVFIASQATLRFFGLQLPLVQRPVQAGGIGHQGLVGAVLHNHAVIEH